MAPLRIPLLPDLTAPPCCWRADLALIAAVAAGVTLHLDLLTVAIILLTLAFLAVRLEHGHGR